MTCASRPENSWYNTGKYPITRAMKPSPVPASRTVDEPSEPGLRHEIAVPDREKSDAAHIELAPQGRSRSSAGIDVSRPEQQAETDDQANHPDAEQQHHRERAVNAEEMFSVAVPR